MKLLLHSCCGPCTIYPASVLRLDEFDITAYFFNPNIHPFTEFRRRKETLSDFCSDQSIPLILEKEYGLRDFLRKVVYLEKERCFICYSWRLEKTVRYAAANGYAAFTSTLLYSKYQNHLNLKEVGFHLANRYGIKFIYRDFRDGWQKGIDESKQLEMYRQPYCGCIYSEQERYDNTLRKRKKYI